MKMEQDTYSEWYLAPFLQSSYFYAIIDRKE